MAVISKENIKRKGKKIKDKREVDRKREER